MHSCQCFSDHHLSPLPFSDCVITEHAQEESKEYDVITVRLQGKEKGSAQEYSMKKVCMSFWMHVLFLCRDLYKPDDWMIL